MKTQLLFNIFKKSISCKSQKRLGDQKIKLKNSLVKFGLRRNRDKNVILSTLTKCLPWCRRLTFKKYVYPDVCHHTISGRSKTAALFSVLSSHSKRRPKLVSISNIASCRSKVYIFLTFFKRPFVFKTFVLSIFEW